MNMAEKIEVEEVPKGYKKTEIGILPENWEVIPILECCDFERGTEPGSKSYNRKGIGIPFIRVGNISKGQQELVYTTSDNVKLCDVRDILFALDGSPGAVAKGWKGAYASGIRKVVIKEEFNEKVYYDFLYYILQHPIVQDIITKHTTGVTILHASKSLNYIKIPLPPLQEQKKIAKILDKIRQAIELQDREIETWKKMKKAMMAKVFREGLHGEELKDTEIGKVPSMWEVAEFSHLVSKERIKVGKIKKEDYKSYGKIPIIDQSQQFIAGYSDNSELAYLGPLPIIIFGDHTLIFKFVDFPFILGADGAKIIIPNKRVVDPLFFYYALIHAPIKSRGYSRHYKYLKELKFPLPPLQEQKEIAHILSTIDKKIEIEKRRKEILEKLFKAMLHLFMTGKLRVKEVEI